MRKKRFCEAKSFSRSERTTFSLPNFKILGNIYLFVFYFEGCYGAKFGPKGYGFGGGAGALTRTE